MDNFKHASRIKLRISTNRGLLSVEQLWDLNLQELNTLALALKKDYDASGGESFLDETTEKDTVTKLKFDVVLDVLQTKKKEEKEKRDAKEIKEHNRRIDELIASKKEKELESKSIEELEKLRK